MWVCVCVCVCVCSRLLPPLLSAINSLFSVFNYSPWRTGSLALVCSHVFRHMWLTRCKSRRRDGWRCTQRERRERTKLHVVEWKHKENKVKACKRSVSAQYLLSRSSNASLNLSCCFILQGLNIYSPLCRSDFIFHFATIWHSMFVLAAPFFNEREAESRVMFGLETNTGLKLNRGFKRPFKHSQKGFFSPSSRNVRWIYTHEQWCINSGHESWTAGKNASQI